MADIDKICKIYNVYKYVNASIDAKSAVALQQTIGILREQKGNLTLDPPMRRCIDKNWLEGFQICSESSNELDADTVEAATRAKTSDFLFYMLDHGWGLDNNLRDGTLPSVLCLALDNTPLLKNLLDRGANPNALSSTAETPLSIAIRSGPMKAIQILTAAGGDVRLGDLLHCAVERKRGDTQKIITFLVQRGAQIDSIQHRHPVARQLRGHLKCGTALHLACQLGHLVAVSALLEHGANPLSTRLYYDQEEKTTPLAIATAQANSDILMLLKKALKSRRSLALRIHQKPTNDNRECAQTDHANDEDDGEDDENEDGGEDEDEDGDDEDKDGDDGEGK